MSYFESINSLVVTFAFFSLGLLIGFLVIEHALAKIWFLVALYFWTALAYAILDGYCDYCVENAVVMGEHHYCRSAFFNENPNSLGMFIIFFLMIMHHRELKIEKLSKKVKQLNQALAKKTSDKLSS